MAVFNVKDFGARGNGVDDDTETIQAALARAGDDPASGPVALWFPPGVYLISDHGDQTPDGPAPSADLP